MSNLTISKAGARRPFTPEEDAFLFQLMTREQCASWEELAQLMAGRTPRQCKDRWMNYLSPAVRTGPWHPAEDELLVAKINEIGHTWSALARYFNGRSESDVKNRWYSHLKYRTVRGAGNSLMLMREWEQDRKKRNRKPVYPKQTVMLLLAKKSEEPPHPRFEERKATNDSVADIESWCFDEPMSEPFDFDGGLF
jgi:hypothetical protein